MSYVEQEFADRVFSILSKYRRSTGSGFKLNARCPICGDSKLDPNKARFWAYQNNDGSVRLHCFNHDYDQHISGYLKEYEPDMYREYLLEKRKEQTFFKKEEPKQGPSEKIKAVLPKIEKLEFCDRLDTLPDNHPIVRYVSSRCIPRAKWNRLWFTMQWPALVNTVNPGTYKDEKNEPRLVIPIFNANKEIESMQGRALRKDAPQKYITIKAHEEATKIYGLDTVDPNKTVWITEGPIDSLFLDNAISITGGSLALELVPFKENRVWVMDNEPRKPDTIKRMKKLIDAGERIVFWDNSPWESKDINDMVKDEGASLEQISEYLNSNSAQGLIAKMRFAKYAKV